MSLIDNIADAIRHHQPLPALAAGSSLTLDEAYDLQRSVFDAVAGAPPAGIKAGVTSDQLQKVFRVEHALLGRLYPAGAMASGDSFTATPGKLIECELGVVVNTDGQPIAVCPALEFAYAGFANPGDASAPYLTAGNVAADQFLAGNRVPWEDAPDLSAVRLRLYRNDEPVNEAQVDESLGGPSKAAAWITTEALQRGFVIPDDCLLMTGACGQVLPAEPGHYRADYGPLGELRFSITT